MVKKVPSYWFLRVAVFSCMLVSAMVSRAQVLDIVGYVNKQTVERNELNREIENSRADVMNQLIQQHQLTELSNFWLQSFGGVLASDILKKKAWENLKKAKVQEELFKAQNLWPYQNNADLKAKMNSINQNRLKMKAEGKVIYGPLQFTEKSFYDYEFSNAIIKVKDKLFPRPIADTVLLKRYRGLPADNANSDTDFKTMRIALEAAFIDGEYENLIREKLNSAQLIINE